MDTQNNPISSGVGRLTRNIVLSHPYNWPCVIYRRTYTSVVDMDEEAIGRLSQGEDSRIIDFEHIGSGYALPAASLAMAGMVKHGDMALDDTDAIPFLIEPIEPSGMPGYFAPKQRDIMLLLLHEHLKVAYEIVGIETPMHLSPFVTRYLCNRHAALDLCRQREWDIVMNMLQERKQLRQRGEL